MKLNKSHSNKKNKDAEHRLYNAFITIKTAEEARRFLADLCTPTEIQAMADRWQVVDLLKNNISYRQIYEKTGVSVATITRVARCLAADENGYNIIYQRLQKK